jgi:hypothetical protein
MALKINEELEGLNAAKKELMYGKHRLIYQTYSTNTYDTNKWDTWPEWKMEGIREILDKHHRMIEKEIQQEISELNKKIESL